MSQPDLTSARPKIHAILSLPSVLLSWQNPSVFETGNLNSLQHCKPSRSLPRSLLRKNNLDQADQTHDLSTAGMQCMPGPPPDRGYGCRQDKNGFLFLQQSHNTFLIDLKLFFNDMKRKRLSSHLSPYPSYIDVEEKVFIVKKKSLHTHISMMLRSTCMHILCTCRAKCFSPALQISKWWSSICRVKCLIFFLIHVNSGCCRVQWKTERKIS